MSKVLFVASAGGHWEQLMLLAPSFADRAMFVTTMPGLAEVAGVGPAIVVPDCNRNRPLDIIRCAWRLLRIITQHQPHTIVSTGAAPGLLALVLGKVLGARTVWIDSVANAERLSMSGQLAGKVADVWLTQWRHLASPNGPSFLGSLL